MDEKLFFEKVILDMYGLVPSRLERLNTSSLESGQNIYAMYHIEHVGSPHILFSYHDDYVTGSTFHWCQNEPLEVWLRHRAQLLMYLAEQNYPAPRILVSQSQACIARFHQWNFLVTTYIDGEANILSPDNMFLLGGALGKLHSLPLPSEGTIGLSWWNSRYSIPHALELCDRNISHIPPTYHDFVENIQATFHCMQQKLPLLPEVIIHADCWAPNAIMQESKTVLIDWECAGLGAAILDLGTLLLRCQYDQSGEIPEEINAEHIDAAISGYIAYRSPSPDELNLLLEAVRFSIAWGGAWLIAHRLKEGWNPRFERLLARVQRGYRLAEMTAHFALSIVAQKLGNTHTV